MGAMGCDNASTQENKTKRDTMNKKNGPSGYDFGPFMAGEISQNRHVCVDGHTGARGTQVGEDAFGWVQGDAYARVKRKTKVKTVGGIM